MISGPSAGSGLPGIRPRATGSAGRRVCRLGYTLIEGAVACLLMALVLPPVVSGLAAARRTAEATTRRAEANSAARGVFTLLSEELRRTGGLGPHAALSGPDELGLRAFRVAGLPCGPGRVSEGGVGTPAALTLPILPSGTRLPDATKDSVEALLPDGTLWRTSLRAVTHTSECEEGWAVTVEGSPGADPLLLRFYERGHYSLSGSALRYRRGGGGRQPLTPERVTRGDFIESPSLPGLVGVRFELSPDLPEVAPRDIGFVLGGRR